MRDERPLVEALVTAFLVFEGASDDEIDPRIAVRAMENMSADLLNLDTADQVHIRAVMAGISTQAEEESYRRFVEELPDMIGLAQ